MRSFATGLNEAKLFRVLRLAVAQGLLAGSTDRGGVSRFRNNAISATLREDHPNCTRCALHFQSIECRLVLPNARHEHMKTSGCASSWQQVSGGPGCCPSASCTFSSSLCHIMLPHMVSCG